MSNLRIRIDLQIPIDLDFYPKDIKNERDAFDYEVDRVLDGVISVEELVTYADCADINVIDLSDE